VFKTGTPSDVFVAVRKTTITVKVDSKTVVSFKGDFNRLSMQRKDMDIPNQEVLYLVTYRTIFHFKKIELTPVSGEGKPTVATE
jgi:hypothetical protein